MALIGLIVVVVFILAVLSCLPKQTYRCPECGWSTWNREEAAGHNGIHALHKIPL
jgi:hypothetical protein